MFKTSEANFRPIFLSGKFPRCTLYHPKIKWGTVSCTPGCFFVLYMGIQPSCRCARWLFVHHCDLQRQCARGSTNRGEFSRATFAKDALFKMHPQSSILLFFGNCREGLKMLYMTMQHHSQQNIILAQGAALCKKYSARQHDSPWLNTTVHCTDCRKLQYARWNH